MSHDYLTSQDKHQKVRNQSYLNNPNEPLNDPSSESIDAHSALLIEDSSSMRRRFRARATELRRTF